ncbi:putative xyloglucan 6-xylosyltransferase [Helianthus annuus]|nr:putative xyloglucan 6-xylosyltransferase [Helianthus annuus]KAJ0627332.1 putative xyloglucan 6-xylosyltransferase [Helianthus annuus]
MTKTLIRFQNTHLFLSWFSFISLSFPAPVSNRYICCSTAIVLRTNLGAGKFGTSEQDFKEICETFYQYRRKRAEPRRVLEEIETTTEQTTSSGTNSYAEVVC